MPVVLTLAVIAYRNDKISFLQNYDDSERADKTFLRVTQHPV